jgi:hypothetical protein
MAATVWLPLSALSGGDGVRPSGVGLRQALTRRRDGVLAWARPDGGAGRGDGRGRAEQERGFAVSTFLTD